MSELTLQLVVFLIGITAGFADSTVGSGGLISIPALIFLGFPPQVALATDRLGSVGQTAAALVKFWRAKKIHWRLVPMFTLLAVLGSLVGARLLITVNADVLQKIVGFLLILLLPFLFYNKPIGIKPYHPSFLKTTVGLVIYFLIMVYNGFFGTGSGPFALYTALYFFGLTIIEANATGTLPWFILSISSLVVFANNGIIDYQNGVMLLLGMTIGGWLGARTAVVKGDAWIRKLFIAVVILSSVKLLFWS